MSQVDLFSQGKVSSKSLEFEISLVATNKSRDVGYAKEAPHKGASGRDYPFHKQHILCKTMPWNWVIQIATLKGTSTCFLFNSAKWTVLCWGQFSWLWIHCTSTRFAIIVESEAWVAWAEIASAGVIAVLLALVRCKDLTLIYIWTNEVTKLQHSYCHNIYIGFDKTGVLSSSQVKRM